MLKSILHKPFIISQPSTSRLPLLRRFLLPTLIALPSTLPVYHFHLLQRFRAPYSPATSVLTRFTCRVLVCWPLSVWISLPRVFSLGGTLVVWRVDRADVSACVFSEAEVAHGFNVDI